MCRNISQQTIACKFCGEKNYPSCGFVSLFNFWDRTSGKNTAWLLCIINRSPCINFRHASHTAWRHLPLMVLREPGTGNGPPRLKAVWGQRLGAGSWQWAPVPKAIDEVKESASELTSLSQFNWYLGVISSDILYHLCELYIQEVFSCAQTTGGKAGENQTT